MSSNAHLDSQGLPPGYFLRPEWELTPRQVKAMLDRRDAFVLVDCRRESEHRIAHLSAARLVPLQELASRLEELEEHRDKKLVVYCHHGVRSLQMAMLLRQQGFKDVRSMAGGIDLWAQDIEPTMKRY